MSVAFRILIVKGMLIIYIFIPFNANIALISVKKFSGFGVLQIRQQGLDYFMEH
jgi:hypothetical protein